MYIKLEEIKQHLNLDEDFTEDDEYLMYLYDVAQDAVETHIDRSLSELEDVDGNLKPALVHAMKLYIGHLYEHREASSSIKNDPVPFAYDYLLDLYQKY